MNAIFKVIWNRSLNVWVAVGEFAKGKQKSTTTQRSFTSQSVGDAFNQYFSPKIAILAAAVMGLWVFNLHRLLPPHNVLQWARVA
ncbi:hypothetical protein B4907_21790 [Yersinia kristensenii]|nr:hypothetical protein B4907_21790 [Yersinia kristensenii]